MKKIRVGILCGGKSGEHEVSLQSAKNILEAINKDRYEVIVIGIDKQGRWSVFDNSDFLLNAGDPENIKLNESSSQLALVPGNRDSSIIESTGSNSLDSLDVVFPVLHGPFGEDGTIQGLLKLANLPFVGASVLGSAVGMDKDVMKRLMRDSKIPIARFITLTCTMKDQADFKDVEKQLGLPFFVKPANLGSSIGISRVSDQGEFIQAIDNAFQFDNKIVIEEYIKGREIECSVLGNDDPVASLPGEIIPQGVFYSYKAKYVDENGARLEIPAKIGEHLTDQVMKLAVKTFRVLCCEGMARVDFFIKENNEIIVNEINTIPGFTKISMYPGLWEKSGIPYSELIDRLIQLALERHKKESRLITSL